MKGMLLNYYCIMGDSSVTCVTFSQLFSPLKLCRSMSFHSADLQMRHQKLFTLARHLSVGHFSK